MTKTNDMTTKQRGNPSPSSDAGPHIERVNRAFYGEPESAQSPKAVDWNTTEQQARASQRHLADRANPRRRATPTRDLDDRASAGRPTPRVAARRLTGD